jgi:translation initiation factor 2 beta subunit (eIF-2beta)/eIF-5
MIEMAMNDLIQVDLYNNSLKPLEHYYNSHKSLVPSEAEIQKLIPFAKQTKFILETFHEIVDNLNYDKERFEEIIFKFDDDYDMLKEFTANLNPAIKSHNEILKISEKILDGLMKAQNDLGTIIAKHEYS